MNLAISTYTEYLLLWIFPFRNKEKEKLNKVRVKGETSKLLGAVLEEKRREIIKEWIESGRIKDINSKR
jgi:hypothetical protein